VVVDDTPKTIEAALDARSHGQRELYETAMQRLVVSADPAERARALALFGLDRFDEKKDDEAIALLTDAAKANPRIAPYLQLRIIDAKARAGHYNEAIEVASPLALQEPATTATTAAQLRLPALFALWGNQLTAAGWLDRLASVPIDELTEQDFVRLGDTLMKADAPALAMRVRLRLLMTYPQGRYTEKIYDEVAKPADSPFLTLGFQELTDLAARLGRVNRYDQALDLLDRISARFPGQVDSSLYTGIRTRSLFNSRRYLELTDDLKLNQPAPAVQLLRARAFWRSGRPQEFLSTVAALQKKWPDSKEATDARLQLAKYYSSDEPKFELATANLEEALAAGVGDGEGENLWMLGWTYLLWGHDDDALRTFDRYLEKYPDGDYRTNSLFWSAKLAAKRNDAAMRDSRFRQLIREYPYSYYAYRSRELLGETAPPPSEIASGFVFPDVDADLAAVTDNRLAVIEELVGLGLVADATKEMKRLVAEHPENRGLAFRLADLYLRTGEAAKANGVLQKRFREFIRHGGTNIPRRFWEILFPLEHWETIGAAAGKRGIDPYLVAGIIRQESGFEPTDVSNAGAVGLMQIMPEEASRIASLGGLPPVTRQDLFDPAINIEIGAAEYAQKLSLTNGQQIAAIAAYNGGEEPVGRWLARTPLDDVDLFVDSIPYAETRLYVKSVTRNQHEYRRIYEHRSTSPP
jgi:soluble lytic murein transglycosylase-like protein